VPDVTPNVIGTRSSSSSIIDVLTEEYREFMHFKVTDSFAEKTCSNEE